MFRKKLSGQGSVILALAAVGVMVLAVPGRVYGGKAKKGAEAKAEEAEEKGEKGDEPAGKVRDKDEKGGGKIKRRDRGFVLVGAMGLDGCTGQRCDNTYPLLYMRFHVLFRVKKYVAAGLHTAFNFLAPNFPTGGGRVEFWEMLFGPEVRGILPVKKFDLWAGFAMGYYRSYRLVDSKGHETESVTDAFGLGWGLGTEWYLLDGLLALGGDIWVYLPVPTKICTKVGANSAVCTKNRSDVKRGFGVTIAAGFTATLFLPL